MNTSSESSLNDNVYESITDQDIDLSTKVVTDLSKSKASTYCKMGNLSQIPVQDYQDNNANVMLTKTMGVEYQEINDKEYVNASHLTPNEVDDFGYLLPNLQGSINATSRSGNMGSASEDRPIRHSYLEFKEMLPDVKRGSACGSISDQFANCSHEEVAENELMAPSLTEISPNVSSYSTETNSSSSEWNDHKTSVSDRTVAQGHRNVPRYNNISAIIPDIQEPTRYSCTDPVKKSWQWTCFRIHRCKVWTQHGSYHA